MNIWRLLLFLLIGTVAMLIPIMLQGSWYRLNSAKRVILAVLLTIAGTLGTFLLYYVENGEFGGTSFFGAVFFVPILFIPVAKLLGIRYHALMDICAPAECMMLVVMKIQCYLTDCCSGVIFKIQGQSFTFPSQLAELTNALVICVILLLLARKEKNRGKLFPIYMIIYGATRFVLNVFRKTKIVQVLFMPFGNFWSLVSIVVGVVWLVAICVHAKTQTKGNKGME